MNNTASYTTELIQKVTAFLDQQLSLQEVQEFEVEVQKNPALQTMIENEQQVRSLLKTKVHRKKASPSLLYALQQKISEHR